jgi:hypothetical protein
MSNDTDQKANDSEASNSEVTYKSAIEAQDDGIETKIAYNRCTFITKKGRCRGMANYADKKCLTHTSTVTPAERTAWRAKGGKNRKKAFDAAVNAIKLESVDDLRMLLEDVATKLLKKEIHPQAANSICNIVNTISKVMELDLTEDINDLKKQIKKHVYKR